jgi:transposase
MRLKSRKRYSIFKDESHCSETAREREEKILLYEKLREEGCSEKTALEAVKTKRSTLYRWRKAYTAQGLVGLEPQSRRPLSPRTRKWSTNDENLVAKLRKKHKIWGKEKIATLMRRDHQSSLSMSSVGRIIAKLIGLGRVRPACVYQGRTTPKKRRVFTGHAQRWKYGQRSSKPGELVQMDHTIITTDSGKELKSFSAICPFTKMIFEHVYSRATSACAADFLKKAKAYFPFPLLSIQVDGGSEFMADYVSTPSFHWQPNPLGFLANFFGYLKSHMY